MLSYLNVISESLPTITYSKVNNSREVSLQDENLRLQWLWNPKLGRPSILIDKWILHFIASIQAHGGNLCTSNHHLLILDGHNSYGLEYMLE